MKFKVWATILGLVCIFICFWFYKTWFVLPEKKKIVQVGLVLSIQHRLMDEIEKGLREELEDLEYETEISVQNTMDDVTMCRNSLQSMFSNELDFVVVVGQTPSQMAVKMNSGESTVIAVGGGGIEEKNTKKCKIVQDDLELGDSLGFLQAVVPGIEKFALVASCIDTVIPQIKKVESFVEQENIKMQKLIVQRLSGLPDLLVTIDPKSQAIVVLKDLTVMSGIGMVIKEAERLKIPLIVADGASVQDGATIAIGVSGLETGRVAGQVIKKELSGANNPFTTIIENKKVFVREQGLEMLDLSIKDIRKIAKGFNCELVIF